MSREVIEKLKRQIAGYKAEVRAEKAGRVIEVGDGVVRIWGLAEARSQEMLTIETARGPVNAIALNLEEDTIGAIILGDPLAVKEGDRVKPTGRVA